MAVPMFKDCQPPSREQGRWKISKMYEFKETRSILASLDGTIMRALLHLVERNTVGDFQTVLAMKANAALGYAVVCTIHWPDYLVWMWRTLYQPRELLCFDRHGPEWKIHLHLQSP